MITIFKIPNNVQDDVSFADIDFNNEDSGTEVAAPYRILDVIEVKKT